MVDVDRSDGGLYSYWVPLHELNTKEATFYSERNGVTLKLTRDHWEQLGRPGEVDIRPVPRLNNPENN